MSQGRGFSDWSRQRERSAVAVQILAVVLGIGPWAALVVTGFDGASALHLAGFAVSTVLMVFAFWFATKASRLAATRESVRPLLYSGAALAGAVLINYLLVMGLRT